jgi:hypothetical protein
LIFIIVLYFIIRVYDISTYVTVLCTRRSLKIIDELIISAKRLGIKKKKKEERKM